MSFALEQRLSDIERKLKDKMDVWEIQNLKKEISDFKNKMQALEDTNTTLRNQIDNLKYRIVEVLQSF